MNFAMSKLDQPIKHTTTPIYVGRSVIGMKYNKGVIMACDTKLNYGSMTDLTNCDQRIKILGQRALIGYSGEFSDLQETSRLLNELILEDELETNGKGVMGPVELGNYLSSLHYYQRNRLNPYLNSAIVGGIDFNGDVVLMEIDPFGTFLKGNYFYTSMGSYFCCALLRNEYPKNPEDLTKDKAIEILKKCFEVLFYRDKLAGDDIVYKAMEKEDNSALPKIEEGKFHLETKWEFEGFKVGNEKNYLVA